MDLDRVIGTVCRVFFAVAFVLLALAVFERVAFMFGYTFLRGTFSGGRLLEIAAVVLIFVIALLLRQIREQLRARAS